MKGKVLLREFMKWRIRKKYLDRTKLSIIRQIKEGLQ